MSKIMGLRRNRQGLLEPITLPGPYGSPSTEAGEPLTPTEETATLRGWGAYDGPARVWRTPAGVEIVVRCPLI